MGVLWASDLRIYIVIFGYIAKIAAFTVENDLRVIRSRLKSWIYCPKRVALDFWAVCGMNI